MTKRDWWLGVAAVVIVVLAHAAFPRYQWVNRGGVPIVRIDRWNGRAEIGHYVDGQWQRHHEQDDELQKFLEGK